MKYTVAKKEGSLTEIEITLTASEWEEANQKAYLKNKNKYSVQGFRKGHVPRKVLEGIYGTGVFFEEALNDSFAQYYGEVLDKEDGLNPVDRPDVDIKSVDEKGVVFVATVPVKPELTVEKYKGIELDKIEYPVTDTDIDAEIERERDRASRLVPVEGRAAADGDTVIIDYSGSVDGVKFDGGTADKQTLVLGSKSFIPGFEEQVAGMNIGEEKDINITFPEDYADHLKGKAAVFAIKLHEIKKKEVPELNDEFVKDVSEFDTVEKYRESVRKRLEDANNSRARTERENKLIENISEATEVEIPDAMVMTQIDSMVQEMEYRLMYQGAKLDDFLKHTGQTMEQLRDSYRDRAHSAVKTRLIFEALMRQENIVAEQSEIDAKLSAMAESAGKTLDDYKETASERQVEYITNEILVDKLFALLNELNPEKQAKPKAQKEKKTKTAETEETKEKADKKADEKPAKTAKSDAAKK